VGWPTDTNFRGRGAMDAWFLGTPANDRQQVFASSGYGFQRLAALELRAYWAALPPGTYTGPAHADGVTSQYAYTQIPVDGTWTEATTAGFVKAWEREAARDPAVRDALAPSERVELDTDFAGRFVGRSTTRVAAWFATARTVPLASVQLPYAAVLPLLNVPPLATDGDAPANTAMLVFDPSRGPSSAVPVGTPPAPAPAGGGADGVGPGWWILGGLAVGGAAAWLGGKSKRKRSDSSR
jgi:hypothetical protein